MYQLIFLWLLVTGVLLGGGPALFGPTDPRALVPMGFGVVSLIAGACVIIVTKLWVKTSANIAYYMTGGRTPHVVIDGGALFIPVVHELMPVTLETMKLEVKRHGPDALICRDFLRVDVSAEFYIRVAKTEEGVKAAATTLGNDATDPERIRNRLLEKLVSALRTVAATMDLNELHQNREEFASRVLKAVTKDIDPNGLLLETVTISQLDQTDIANLKAENVFDAQGIRKATEITQVARVERNKLERNAELEITTQNVATRKRVLEEEQTRSFAEADQSAKVAQRLAERKREVAEFELAQQEQVEKRNVQKVREVKAAEIQREAMLIEENQKREKAEVLKLQAIEVAKRDQQVALAMAEARRADAEATQRLAEAKEREAAENVKTAAELAAARREKEKAVIKAEQAGETNLIEQQKLADAEAYTKTRQAEAQVAAAENEATAKIRLSEAVLESKRREAEAERVLQMVPIEVDREAVKVEQQRLKATQMVPVEVDAERVRIEAQRVEVLRSELAAKDSHQQAAIHLEVARMQIEAQKEIGKAMAAAMGQFMSHGSFQVFGDPNTLATMMERFNQGLGLSQMVMGMRESNPLLGKVVDSGLAAAGAGLDAFKAKAEASVAAAAPAPAPTPAEEPGES